MPTKIEELGDEFRKDNIVKNYYQDSDGKQYSATHKNAIGDGDAAGKGSGDGSNADNINTTTGGNVDDAQIRDELVAKNEGKYDAKEGPGGFGPDKPYYPNYIMSKD